MKIEGARFIVRWIKIFFLCAPLALSIVPLENKLYWGYWITPPVLFDDIAASDSLLGMAKFMININSPSGEIEDVQAVNPIIDARRLESDASYKDLGVTRLLRIIGDKSAEVLQPLNKDMLSGVWENYYESVWRSEIGHNIDGTALPYMGYAIYYQRANKEKRILITCFTTEIRNDRHAYTEALLKLIDSNAKLINQVYYYYEVAGLEGIITLRFLAAMNLVLLLPISFIIAITLSTWH